jgi:DNA-binding transcriptional MerR regulator
VAEALRIGELARRSGRSVHTIRWYEAQGLMPGVVRDRAGRRVYGADHLVWLELVDRLRLTGMTIAEMRAYAKIVQQGRAGRPRLRQILAAHADATRGKVRQLQEAVRFLEHKIAFYDDWIAAGVRPPIPKRPRPARRPAG